VAAANSSTPTPMGKGRTRFLVVYLLVATTLTFYAVYSLWPAQPQIAPSHVPAPACAAAAGPALSSLYPPSLSVGSTVSNILILGCGFTTATQVKVNGTQRSAVFVDASHVRVALTDADVAAVGSMVVTLSSGGADFGSGVLAIGPATISQELQLLLMVVFAGAFGSCVYALKSLADYLGDEMLHQTWFTFYLIQPFEGAGIAFLLYLVIRGGFLAGTGTSLSAASQFSMCAVGGLAGAFSDTAFLKLREVFQTLFKPQDDRGGKLTLQITTTSLKDGVVGADYQQPLQASGGTAPLTWSVDPDLPAGLSLDQAKGVISGKPTAVSAKTTYKFTVTDSAQPAAQTSANLTLAISQGTAAAGG